MRKEALIITLPRERFPRRDMKIRNFCTDFQSPAGVDHDSADGFFKSVWQIGYRAAMRMKYVDYDFCKEVAAGTVLRVFEAIKNGGFVPYEGVPTAAFVSGAARFEGGYILTRKRVRDKHEIHDPLESFANEAVKNLRPTEDAVEQKLFIEEIVSCINKYLTSPQQQVMDLLVAGYTQKEICTMLDITGPEACCRIFRARRILKNLLKELE